MATKQLREIRIKVDAGASDAALRSLSKNFGEMNKSMKQSSSALSSLKDTFQGLFAASIFGFGIRELAGMSDAMQQLNDRIKILSPTTEDAENAFSSLQRVANSTKTSMTGISEIYARLAATTSETGIRTNTLVGLTEILQNSFRLSGSNAQEAANASVQLSQGFALGVVRGQDLKSVLQQNVVVAKIFRKEFGSDVYQKAADGILSASEVMRVLFKYQNEINGSAKELSQTFGQTLTVAMNDFQVAIFKLNQEFGLSGKFAKGIEIVKDKLGLLAGVVSVLTVALIPALLSMLAKVGVAAYGALGPVGLIIGGLAATITYFVKDLEQFQDILIDIFIEINKAAIYGLRLLEAYGNTFLARFVPGLYAAGKVASTSAQYLSDFNDELLRGKEITRGQEGQYGPSKEEFLRETKKRKEQEEDLRRMQRGGAAKDLKEQFAELNKAYLATTISATDYYKAIDVLEQKKVTEEFAKGSISLDKYNEKLIQLKKSDISRDFATGAISLGEFNKAVEENKLEKLNNDLVSGKIALNDYNEEVLKTSSALSIGGAFQVGTQNYLDSIGTTSMQLADAIEGAFGGLETAFTEFVQNGSQDWKKFAQGILDDLTKIIVRYSIIRPLADAILGVGSTSSAPSGTGGGGQLATNQFAKGGAFDNGVQMFANGGIVGAPTLFGMNQSKLGMMGEAGPEAILPLSRGSNGDLGVQASITPVTVNIINNSGADVEKRETTGPSGERVLEVLISRKVNDGIASGTFDKAFASSYGMRGRG